MGAGRRDDQTTRAASAALTRRGQGLSFATGSARWRSRSRDPWIGADRLREDPLRPVSPRRFAWWCVAFAIASALPARGAPPDSLARETVAPPSGLVVSDLPNDAGTSLALEWKASASDLGPGGPVDRYRLERSESPAGPWVAVDSVDAGVTASEDRSVRRDTEYFYRVVAVTASGVAPALSITGPVKAVSQWINTTRYSVLLLTALFFAFVLYYIGSAPANPSSCAASPVSTRSRRRSDARPRWAGRCSTCRASWTSTTSRRWPGW